MKIIRVFFDCFNEQFCIDRGFDDQKSDQENCDNAVQLLLSSMEKNTVIPALKIENKKGAPIFMNLGMVPYISIVNVGTYDMEDKNGDDNRSTGSGEAGVVPGLPQGGETPPEAVQN